MNLQQWAQRWNLPPQALAELADIPAPYIPLLNIHDSEAAVQAALRVDAPKLGGSLWRNNSGAGVLDSGSFVRFGLANDSQRINETFKSSDLIGITPVTWHGRTFGVFTAVEVKDPGWKAPANARDRAQQNFMSTVIHKGGIGTFATCVDHYRQAVKNYVS